MPHDKTVLTCPQGSWISKQRDPVDHCPIMWVQTDLPWTSHMSMGNLKGAEAGCPYVPKDQSVGKKTGLAEQRALAGTLVKNHSL